MALPVAHVSIAWGLSGKRDKHSLVLLGLISFSPDFDLFFVWFLGQSLNTFHRTWSHSLTFALVVAGIWWLCRPERFNRISPLLVFVIVASHAVLDFACTLDVADHGVMFFWPWSDYRIGWAILVPLYLVFGDSPFSWSGALRFSLLEVLLAVPLWLVSYGIRKCALYAGVAAESGVSLSELD